MWIDDTDGAIGKVDVATGVVSNVNQTGRALSDIAFDPSGQMFGITADKLFTINKNTGDTTLVGSLGNKGTGFNALVFGQDGTLYAAGGNSTSLFTVDTTTGAATALPGSLPTTSAGDLAFHNGNLFMAGANDDLIKIKLGATVSGTDKGAFGVTGVFGLADEGNHLYGVAGKNIYSIDTGTGAATLLVNYAGQGLEGGFGAAFANESVTATPEPASLTLVGLGILGMAGYGWPNVRSLTPRSRLQGFSNPAGCVPIARWGTLEKQKTP